jgi:hypothetical protein
MEQNQTQQQNDKDKEIADKKKSSIRTYRGDLSEIVNSKNLSATKIVIEEESKRRQLFKKVGIEAKKNTTLIIASLILLIAGVVSVFLLNILKPTPVINVQEAVFTPIIYTEYQKDLFFENLSKLKLTRSVQDEVAQLDIPLGSLIQLYFTKRSVTEDGTQTGKTLVATDQFMEIIDARISNTLLRFLEPNFTFGFHSTILNSPFLIFKTRSFEDSFPEMIKWEETILEDLGSIFIEDNIVFSKNRLRENNYKFKDIVVENKDVRAILDGGGKILFAYSFPDSETLIITTNKLTLQEIFDRLSTIYHTR